jgi:hypothetical protein
MKKDNKMSKILGASLALTLGLAALPTLLNSASAAPFNQRTAVYGTSSQVVGHDPDPSIRSMLQRDHAHEQGQ